jgi:hypothetical protein
MTHFRGLAFLLLPLGLPLGLGCSGGIEPVGTAPTEEPGRAPDPARPGGAGGRPGGTSTGGAPTSPASPAPGGPGMTGTPGPAAADAAGPRAVRRLTRFELANTLRDLLGEAELDETLLPGDAAADSGFPVGGVMGSRDARRMLEFAETLGARMEARVAGLVTCDLAKTGEEGCARAFVSGFGRRALRRPLAATEIDDFVGLYRKARADHGLAHAGGLRLVLQTMLQAPAFLYHWELGPAGATRAGALIRLDGHEVASRLSYFLWSTMPDAALFEAADGGALATPAEVERQVRRMLADRRAAQAVALFHREWLHVGELEALQKSAKEFDAPLARAMGEELAAFSRHVLLEDGGGRLDTLLTAPFTVASGPLAKLYGVTLTGSMARRIELPPKERAGLLTQAAFLATHATGSESHPIRRGMQVLERLLCVPPPPVPDDVPDPKPAGPTVTTRERFAEHSKNACAAGCHALIDPLGFAFETYDALGRYRTTENGKPVDASGSYALPGSGEQITFANAIELMQKLAARDEVRTCVARQWLRFALGRAETPADERTLADVKRAFSASDHDVRELLVAIAKSPSFLTRTASAGEVVR